MESPVPLVGISSTPRHPGDVPVFSLPRHPGDAPAFNLPMRVPSYNAPDPPRPLMRIPSYDAPEHPVDAPVFNSPGAPVFNSPGAPVFNSPGAPVFNSPGAPVFNSPRHPEDAPAFSLPLRKPAPSPFSYQLPIRRDPFNLPVAIEPSESPDSMYLFDSYVDHHLENELKRVIQSHDRAGNPNINGIYDLGTQRPTLVNLTDIHLSTEAELRNGAVIDGQTYIFPIDKSIYDRQIRMSTYNSPPYSIDRKVRLTHQTIGNHRYIVIGSEDDLNLTPLWGVWTNQACPFPKPCNITFKLQCGPGQIVKETYNLSTSGINTDSASFVALPEFLLRTGDRVRLIFYLEPKVAAPDSTPYSGISFERENLLRKIIIQITPTQSGGRVRRFLRSVWYGNNNNV